MPNFAPTLIALAISFMLGGCKATKVAPGEPQTMVAALNSNWPGTAFNEVRAYNYSPFTAHGINIVEGGRVAPASTPDGGALLSHAQTRRLLTAIKNEYTPHQRAFCHNPRHGFVFFKEGSPVAHLSVCFECGSYTASARASLSRTWDLGSIRTILEELDLWPGEPFKLEFDWGIGGLGPDGLPTDSTAIAPDGGGDYPFIPPGSWPRTDAKELE